MLSPTTRCNAPADKSSPCSERPPNPLFDMLSRKLTMTTFRAPQLSASSSAIHLPTTFVEQRTFKKSVAPHK